MKLAKPITIDSSKTVARKRVDARRLHREANARMIPKLEALRKQRKGQSHA
jgi:hypothetical protein